MIRGEASAAAEQLLSRRREGEEDRFEKKRKASVPLPFASRDDDLSPPVRSKCTAPCHPRLPIVVQGYLD